MNTLPDTPYLVLAYYYLQGLEDYKEEIRLHKEFFAGRDAAARIYINEVGINGQMSASRHDAIAYMEWMHARTPFKSVYFKVHGWHEQAFPRLTIKYRKNLVAYDEEVKLELGGKHLSPAEWRERLERKDDHLLLDVRNDYEWKVGHFEGSVLPPCETFRDFRQYADELKETEGAKKRPIMMCCTGGIRCELYSAILKEKGFEEVYQLDGGIINYGLKEGNTHWKGKLFVFDDRLTVDICDKPAPVVGTCHHCGSPAESYYNCANMDCNTLFLCCPDCADSHLGCCRDSCKTSNRLRPYCKDRGHKPFRRQHHYFDDKN